LTNDFFVHHDKLCPQAARGEGQNEITARKRNEETNFCEFSALYIGKMNCTLNLMGMDTFIQNTVKGVTILVVAAVVSCSTKLNIFKEGPDELGNQDRKF
jgi:hypothetical protein